jgi:hypothetical protein
MRKFIIIAASLAALAAHAEGQASGSEQLHQAGAGANEGTATLSYESEKIEFKGGGDFKVKGETLGLQYEHGLNEMLSLGGKISYDSLKNSTTGSSDTDRTGLEDIDLFLKGNMAAGPGTFRFKVDLTVTPEDSKTKSNGDTNAASGGNNLAPMVAYELPMGPGIGGAYLSTEVDIGKGKTTVSGGSSDKFKGGNSTIFGLFYENPLDAGNMIGGNLEYETVSDSTFDTAGTQDNLSKTITLSVYSKHAVGSGFLLPRLSYATSSDDKIQGLDIDSASGFKLDVGYRMTF